MATHSIKIICLVFFFPALVNGQEKPLFSLIEDSAHSHYGALQFEPTAQIADLQDLDQENWGALLKLYPIQDAGGDYSALPSMLGEIIVGRNNIYFVPRFPFIQGMVYQLYFNIKKGYELLERDLPKGQQTTYQQLIRIPVIQSIEATFVEKVYPSTNEWPANQLKFYVYFSAPMRFGEAFKHIHLQDENGEFVIEPFLLIEQELWDQERKRLTVWFDPGRIKRGLIPNLEKGPPLAEDKQYNLVIQKEWEDLNGQILSHTFIKPLKIVAADREMPKPENWTILPPAQDTPEPLCLRFDEPMDYALLQSAIVVMNVEGEVLKGQVEIREEEQQWCFIPEYSWASGHYKIRLSHDLEDLGGNNLVRLFDSDPTQNKKVQNQLIKPFIELPFTIIDVQSKK